MTIALAQLQPPHLWGVIAQLLPRRVEQWFGKPLLNRLRLQQFHARSQLSKLGPGIVRPSPLLRAPLSPLLEAPGMTTMRPAVEVLRCGRAVILRGSLPYCVPQAVRVEALLTPLRAPRFSVPKSRVQLV